MNHLSINAASELLERQRRTIRKALRGTPPDSFEKGQSRWRLATIIAALQKSGAPLIPPHQVSGNGEDDELARECTLAFERFDKAFSSLEQLPKLEQRRSRAVALGDMLADSVAKMRLRDEAAGLHPEHVHLKGQEVYRLTVWGFCAPCRWSREEAWQRLVVSRNGDLSEEGPDDDR
jgi:hypothetical protein